MNTKLHSFLKTKKAAGLIEYGMLVGLISVLAIYSVMNLGETTKTTFETVSLTLASTQNIAETSENTPPNTDTTPQTPPLVETGTINFTAGQRSGGAWDGLCQGCGTNTAGSVLSSSGTHTITNTYSWNTYPGRTDVYISGNTLALYENATLTCDGLGSFSFNEDSLDSATPPTYNSGNNVTSYRWINYEGPTWVSGQTYTCSISAPE